ncbi:hypothetical protein FD21_GL001437 [Liquorilactobacillus vini DSM 20605]|uniref:Uncharacterized protein n=2 Tax=Liquorilactobacillus vini TaxID=238015 RepID=A0A0R2C579_9LACO|nr:hypothetical protein FD21_GL001437 [Liquorilactobacillus vini DSM 20605]
MLFPAITFLMIFASASYLQILWYQQRMSSYQSQLDHNQAVILRNIAIANSIKKNQIMKFAQQKVEFQGTKYRITLENGRQITLNSPLNLSE